MRRLHEIQMQRCAFFGLLCYFAVENLNWCDYVCKVCIRAKASVLLLARVEFCKAKCVRFRLLCTISESPCYCVKFWLFAVSANQQVLLRILDTTGIVLFLHVGSIGSVGNRQTNCSLMRVVAGGNQPSYQEEIIAKHFEEEPLMESDSWYVARGGESEMKNETSLGINFSLRQELVPGRNWHYDRLTTSHTIRKNDRNLLLLQNI